MKLTHFALDTGGEGMDASRGMLNIMGAVMSLGLRAVNLSTLRSTLLRMSCTHSALRHTKKRGDLDSDGQITVVDVIIELQMTVSGVYYDAADMNRNGMVTSVDAFMTL